MLVVLLIAGCLAIFWIGIALLPESPNEKFVREHEEKKKAEERLSNNLRELRVHRDMACFEFRTLEDNERFVERVRDEGLTRLLPLGYREQVENYICTKPLTIVQARAELKAECEKIYMSKYHARLGTPTSCIRGWENWEESEELAITDPVRYKRLVKCGAHEPWFCMPKDEDFIYCVLDIIVDDGFPDTAKLYKYISNLTDNGIEKLMGIIGNKLERLNG